MKMPLSNYIKEIIELLAKSQVLDVIGITFELKLNQDAWVDDEGSQKVTFSVKPNDNNKRSSISEKRGK